MRRAPQPSRQAEAEDVAQEVFLKIYQRLDSFRGDCRFSTRLYRLAINTTIDCQRRERKFVNLTLEKAAELPGSENTAAFAASADVSKRVNRAVRGLPQTQRMMVHLFYWLDYRIREIAEVMGCPEGTVKVYLSRSRKLLAE